MRGKKSMMLLLGAAMLMLAGCGSNAGKVANPDGGIAYANHETLSGVPQQLHDGIQSLASADGIAFEDATAEGNANVQLDQVNKMIDDKVAAIVLVAVNGDSIIPAVNRANEAGIPVIATNRDVNGGIFTNVVNNERQAGELQAEYMAAHLPQNGKVVYITGDTTITAGVYRWEGFRDTLKAKRPDVEILANSGRGDWEFANGLKQMTLWLQLYPQIDGVAAGNDSMALGAVAAMKEAGRFNPDSVIVCGVDAIPDALKAIESGDMDMTVKQDVDKIIETIYSCIKQAKSGTMPQAGDVQVSMKTVTKENASRYK